MLEAAITNSIKSYLKTLPDVFCYKHHGGTYSTAGIPDLICCIRGRFVAFEVKTDTGKTTMLQDVTIRNIIKAGGIACVVRSVADVKNAIAEILDTTNDK